MKKKGDDEDSSEEVTKTIDVGGFGLNCLCILIVSLVALFLKFAPIPRSVGIHCDDVTIRKEYKGNTIGGPQIIILVSITTAIVILITEGITSFYRRPTIPIRYKLGALKFGEFLYNSFNYYWGFFYGFAGYFLICCVIKIYCGRLRPNFLAVCDPDPATFICDGSDVNRYGYTEDYHCRGDPRLVKDARESFPSLHAASAAGSALYICAYLNAKITKPVLQPMRTLFQLLFVVLALVVSLQRITDNAHHWTDVLAGFIIGILGAIYTLHCVVHWFTESNGIDIDFSTNGCVEHPHVKLS
ncbi:phospholipid phosphatase 2-like [Lineus longissimus]|uniref:phospholipid phosphatase 2-like n=1 Tax=Lineus longissimus TaxID=88925 RepID=UPI002B4F6A1C